MPYNISEAQRESSQVADTVYCPQVHHRQLAASVQGSRKLLIMFTRRFQGSKGWLCGAPGPEPGSLSPCWAGSGKLRDQTLAPSAWVGLALWGSRNRDWLPLSSTGQLCRQIFDLFFNFQGSPLSHFYFPLTPPTSHWKKKWKGREYTREKVRIFNTGFPTS